MKSARYIGVAVAIVVLYVLGLGPAVYISIKAPVTAGPLRALYRPLVLAGASSKMFSSVQRDYIYWWAEKAGLIGDYGGS
jgi:hypothetical protein